VVAEGCGESEITAGDGLVGPAVGVSDDVVVASPAVRLEFACRQTPEQPPPPQEGQRR
jgi:hypothetical protein